MSPGLCLLNVDKDVCLVADNVCALQSSVYYRAHFQGKAWYKMKSSLGCSVSFSALSPQPFNIFWKHRQNSEVSQLASKIWKYCLQARASSGANPFSIVRGALCCQGVLIQCATAPVELQNSSLNSSSTTSAWTLRKEGYLEKQNSVSGVEDCLCPVMEVVYRSPVQTETTQ